MAMTVPNKCKLKPALQPELQGQCCRSYNEMQDDLELEFARLLWEGGITENTRTEHISILF